MSLIACFTSPGNLANQDTNISSDFAKIVSLFPGRSDMTEFPSSMSIPEPIEVFEALSVGGGDRMGVVASREVARLTPALKRP